MTPGRWAIVERVYHLARARPAAEREMFLDEICAGDAALRREVESLLGQSASGDGFLSAPAQGATARARAAYQDFFNIWKNADPDVPVLTQAMAEYSKLQ